jgi:CRP-like cAMP-binding protein
VVNPRIDEHAGVSHALYEPGQVIVPLGETRRYHYLVEAGEVDVVAPQAAGESLLATLKMGEYFGHATRPNTDCCIRARTRVRLLAIDGDAAEALSEVRPDLAILLKQGTRTEAA